MNDDDTQPSEMPKQPKTVQLPAMTDRALLEDLTRVVRGIADGVNEVRSDIQKLNAADVDLLQRMGAVEGRLAKLESPTNPPPPLTSTRVKALIETHPSQMDLELQAVQAAEIVRDQERDRRIEETHALVLQAATKEDMHRLTESTATKAEVKELVEAAAEAQTEALLARLNVILQKPYVKLAITALGALITGWLAGHGVTVK